MENNPFTKLKELSSSKLIKRGGLLGISCLALACIAFQENNSTLGQDKKNEQARDKRDEQTTVEKRIPDDLTDNFILPYFVNDCFDRNKWLDKEIDVPSVPLHNPYFVRGDFDGDRNVDYAVIVESRKDRREGLLVCFRNKETKAVLLGLDANKPPPFWHLMNWDVETKEEVPKTTDSKGKSIGITPRGESIVMQSEGWIGIVYWDGNAFRWKEVILNDGN
ncbi:MAG: hypothetical protein IPJ30_10165 [Acidobacteria bacterium]|nr:hypothetical protein [Acidobacteriota bacterium]